MIRSALAVGRKELRQIVRDGRTLCEPHRTSGVPHFYYPGCVECEKARGNGIIRDRFDSVDKKSRRSEAVRALFNRGAI